MDMQKIEQLIQIHLDIKKQLDELTAKDKTIKQELEFEMKHLGLNDVEDSYGNIARYREVETSRLDKKLVEQKLAPEVFNECFKTTSSSRLTILSKESKDRQTEMCRSQKSAERAVKKEINKLV